MATALAEHLGLPSTMVFSHLPSNVLLAAIGFAPNLRVGLALLVARSALSSMDVPTRRPTSWVSSHPRNAPGGYTNTARYLARPLGPILAGAGQGLFDGLPFVVAGGIVAGGIKAGYDLVPWRWFRAVHLADGAIDRLVAASRAGPRSRCPRPPRGSRDRLPTVVVPPAARDRHMAWIADGRAVREAYGILAEWVLEPADRDPDTVVVTVWPSHAVFEAWIATPERDSLTASDVHQALSYTPIVRYDRDGGYTNLDGLAALGFRHQPPTEEDRS